MNKLIKKTNDKIFEEFIILLLYLDMNFWGFQGTGRKMVGERKTSY